MRTIAALALAALALSFAACADDPPPEASAAQSFTRTIVTLHEDGTSSVHQETFAKPLFDPNAPDAAPTDPACLDADLRLFDQPDLGGNELCFYARQVLDPLGSNGAVQLSDYPRGWVCSPDGVTCLVRDWSKAVRSYATGDSHGYFEIPSLTHPMREYFVPTKTIYQASGLVKNATALTLQQ